MFVAILSVGASPWTEEHNFHWDGLSMYVYLRFQSQCASLST